jgi:POT family proton-dependent oligopeptide transporter
MASANGAGAVPIEKPGFWQTLLNHPAGFWFIFWGELAERCSFYGMRAILAVFMARQLDMGEEWGGSFYFTFVAACYFLPLLGGWIADNFLGKYNTIVLFSLPYILGHVILGFENYYALAIALSLLAMGSGVIKPNISPLMGLTYDQFRPGEEQLRSNAFGIFYMAINIGAAISQIIVPFLRTRYGYFIAFLFPAVLMAVAFVVFAAGKPFYAREVIRRTQKTPEERALQWQVLGQVGLLFILCMFFWAMFDQSSGTWIYFAGTYMNRDLFVFGYQLDVEMMQAINPILIVMLVPLTTILWTALDVRGIKVRATQKMILGFVLTALCMGVMAYCGYSVRQVAAGEELPPAERISIRWQVLAYVCITLAEILISVTGLELAFVAAPKSMKGFVTSLWLVSVALGNLFLNVPFSWLYPRMAPGHYFAMLAGLLVVVGVAFYFVARQYDRKFGAVDVGPPPAPIQPPPTADGVREGYPAGKPSAGIQAGLPPE